MKFKFNAEFTSFQQDELRTKLGLNPGGRVQKVVDATTMHYLRLLMPRENGLMISNTRNREPGLITVETPYAHYMNEGILYVDPKTKKGAFHNPQTGEFWSRPNVKKNPSGKPLKYHGGPNRGAHFVERTLIEHFDDIVKAARKEVRR